MTTESKPVKAASRPQSEPFILPGTTIGGEVGTFRVDFTINNPNTGQSRVLTGLVDTGASYTIIPAAILEELGVEWRRTARVRYADGLFEDLRVGWVEMELAGETDFVHILFGSDSDTCLLGAMTLEVFALAADAYHRRLIPAQVTA